jgi:hypothetical protein
MNNRRALPLAKVYGLLETGPVVLVTTLHKKRANGMTMSWHTMMEFEPPFVGCVISARNFSYAALCKTRQCVLNIPTVEIASAVVGCGNTSGRKIDKFTKFGLTPVTAGAVESPIPACGTDITSLSWKYSGLGSCRRYVIRARCTIGDAESLWSAVKPSGFRQKCGEVCWEGYERSSNTPALPARRIFPGPVF